MIKNNEFVVQLPHLPAAYFIIDSPDFDMNDASLTLAIFSEKQFWIVPDQYKAIMYGSFFDNVTQISGNVYQTKELFDKIMSVLSDDDRLKLSGIWVIVLAYIYGNADWPENVKSKVDTEIKRRDNYRMN